ncbi:MAG: sensor histidine kinase [Candidatus Omnitrophota bacterium]
MFEKELAVLEKARQVVDRDECSHDEWKMAYCFLMQNYEKLLKNVIKITHIGDKHYKKLMNANDHIQRQKTEFETLNIKLRESNAAKDKLYSILAHDLRNPLHFLLFTSDFIGSQWDKDKPPDESIKKFIDKVFITAQNMSELLENILVWARSQYDDIRCHPINIDLKLLVDDVINYFLENAEKKQIQLLSDIRVKTPAYADANMIKSVIRNLVSNAIKFTGPGGRVTISSMPEGESGDQRVAVCVGDTGVGIPSERLETLFDIGKDNVTLGTAKEKGTGLGLIICKEFVEKNGGNIHVISEVGKGTHFRFTLPMVNGAKKS